MFKKLKGKLKGDDHSAPPAAPPPEYDQDQKQKQHPAPIPGPGPSYQQSALHPSNPYYAPPPPPQQQQQQQQQQPHQQPPPQTHNEKYNPPPGPPHPSTSSFPPQPPPTWSPPPNHDWTIIPDTSLLPPPPSLGYDTSPTANASLLSGDQADAWCRANPLWAPQPVSPPVYAAIQNAQIGLLKPPHWRGDVVPGREAGRWRVVSSGGKGAGDAVVLGNLPVYSVGWDSPLATGRDKVIYFEVGIVRIGDPNAHAHAVSFEEADAGVAIGFVAPPYPTFRLPGWQRGSLAVHGDDGRKYVNDTWGGVDFTSAFQAGERVGIGMRFAVPRQPPGYGDAGNTGKILDIEVFFTRDGKREGGWDGNEELDERCEGGNVGLRGECDLFAAVGVFGGVEVEVFLHPSQWLYRPS